MKAKTWQDTVMTPIQLAEVWLEKEQASGFLLDWDVTGVLSDQNLFDEIEQEHSRAVAERQAEITWDKAYKAGQKEVVKQIREHAINAKRNASEVYEAHKQLKPRDNQAKIRYGGYDSALQDLISYLQAKLKEL